MQFPRTAPNRRRVVHFHTEVEEREAVEYSVCDTCGNRLISNYNEERKKERERFLRCLFNVILCAGILVFLFGFAKHAKGFSAYLSWLALPLSSGILYNDLRKILRNDGFATRDATTLTEYLIQSHRNVYLFQSKEKSELFIQKVSGDRKIELAKPDQKAAQEGIGRFNRRIFSKL